MNSRQHEKEPVKVFLKIRPLKANESSFPYVVTQDRKVLKFEVPNKSSEFSFSSIYDGHTSQKDFFEQTVLPLLEDFNTGFNCLVFTYGVTNSGKTYTLQGIPSDPGILPRALDVVFSKIANHHDDVNPMPKFFNQFQDATASKVDSHEKLKLSLLASSNTGVRSVLNETMISGSTDREVSMFCPSLPAQSVESTVASIVEEPSRVLSDSSIFVSPSPDTAAQVGASSYSIWVSFLEIYNEKITDLLVPPNKNTKSKALKLHEDSSGNTFVGGLSEIKVNSAQEACQILAAGQRNLKYSATSLNQKSSRSHCIFNIKLAKLTETGVKVSLFSFCDLAGSERQSKAKTSGVGMKETAKINASMLQLGQCLKQLRENCEKKQKENKTFVAFRNSKLTHLFQNVLQGSGRAVMIVNIASDNRVIDETFNALKLSAVAQKISTKAAVTTEQPKIVPETPAAVKTYRSALGVPSSAKKCKLSFDKKGPLRQIQEEDNDVADETAVVTSPEISSIHTDENGEDEGSELLAMSDDDQSDQEEEEEDESGSEEGSEESSDQEEDSEVWKQRCRHMGKDLAEKKQTIRNLVTTLNETTESMKKVCEYYECKLDESREERRKQKEAIEKMKEEHNELQKKLVDTMKCLSDKDKELEKVRHEISIIAFDKSESMDEDGAISQAAKIEQLEATLFKSDELCAKLVDEKELITKTFEEQIQKLEADVAKLTEKENEIIAQSESLTFRINTLEGEKEVLVADIEQRTLDHSALQEKHDQLLQELSVKNDQLAKELSVKNDQLAKQQKELDAFRDGLVKRENLSAQNPRKRSLVRDSRSMSSLPSEADVSLQLNVSREIDLMGRDIEALIDSQPVLKKDLKASLLKRRSEMEEMKKAMEKMDESLETSQVRVVMANQILRRSNVLTAAREREHETNRRKKLKLSSELSEKTETIKGLLDTIEAMKAELTSQKNESKKQSDKIIQLQHSMEEYQLEISQLQQNYNEKIESLEKLNTELTSAQQNDSLKQSEELEKLRKSIGDYETKISQLMEQNGSFTSQIDSLRKQNSELSSCLHKMSSLTAQPSQGGTLPKRSGILSIATSLDSKGSMSETSPVEPIDNMVNNWQSSTRIADTSMEMKQETIQRQSRRPPSVPRGKGRKVAAIRKNFESSSRKSGTGLLAKPVGKVGKTVVAKRVTRRRKPPSSLSNVPEDSILEILEETNTCVKMESSYNLRKDNKMSSGTSTTPSLDESTFYATGAVNDSALLTDDNDNAVTSSSGSNSKVNGKRRANKPTKRATRLFTPSVEDDLDVTQDASEINHLVGSVVNTDSVSTRTRRRVARK